MKFRSTSTVWFIQVRYFNPLLPVGGAISLITIISVVVIAWARRGATLFI
jgi:hypothetical protein